VILPRLVVLETGSSLQRLLQRYLPDVEMVPVADLDDALIELSRMPARALLVNAASVPQTLESLGNLESLPADTPVLVCSVPGPTGPSREAAISDRLVKPIARKALMESLRRLEVTEGTVLIVDDEPDALQLFGRMLAVPEQQYQVLLARDGVEAMGILDHCRPDVILVDLVMPNMDGFQFLERKNQDPALCDIPVIVVSARDPVGQPIVSSALAATRSGGLSVRQLVDSIEALVQSLGVAVGDGYEAGAAASGARVSA
jgi:CheY-like chemotaxis protein